MKPNDISRPILTVEETLPIVEELTNKLKNHLEKYGDGAFLHPHETTGCLFGQTIKLSAAADATVYSNDSDAFEERLFKLALPTIFAIASLRKIKNLQ